jgi:hypothetical protein
MQRLKFVCKKNKVKWKQKKIKIKSSIDKTLLSHRLYILRKLKHETKFYKDLIRYLLVYISCSWKINKISKTIEQLTVKHLLIEKWNQNLKLIEYITKNLSSNAETNPFILRKYNTYNIIIRWKFNLEQTSSIDNTGKTTTVIGWIYQLKSIITKINLNRKMKQNE